jgi:hypothetical protein
MNAQQIRAARLRLWRAWVFGGLLWSVVFLGVASLIAWAAGVERSDELFTILMGAMVLALGTYAIVYFGALLLHVGKRLWRREPIMEIED